MDRFSPSRTHLFLSLGLAFFLVIGFFALPTVFPMVYDVREVSTALGSTTLEVPFVTHIPTPVPLKGIYMTSWVAGRKDLRTPLVKLIDDTELNAIVIDIKDYSGQIAFPVDDPVLREMGSASHRITDIKEFIHELHEKNIYVIGRIAVFQDSYMVKKKPELAVRNLSSDAVWKDFKGISWIDPASEEYWHYIKSIGDEAYHVGFDELNFDYIRFPSDGNMKDISYPWSKKEKKSDVLERFFTYLSTNFKQTGAVISADLFGMTTTNKDDLNIGQILEKALPHFDYIAPMVYPSHYPAGFMGFANPATKPYEVIKYSMDKAVERSSTTPNKLRPWLQDFNLGATYTADMVKSQEKAVYDAGLTSWLLWNASNRYTVGALLKDVPPLVSSSTPSL